MIMVSNSGLMSTSGSSNSFFAKPALAEANTKGQSSCSSEASRSMNSSRVSSITSSGLASGRSILFTQTITDKSSSRAF